MPPSPRYCPCFLMPRTKTLTNLPDALALMSKQPPPDHALLVLLIREDPADDVAGDEVLGGIALHVERRGTVALHVAPLDAAEAFVPFLEVCQAQIDPSALRITIDRGVVEFDHGMAGGHGRDADARATSERELAVALAQD